MCERVWSEPLRAHWAKLHGALHGAAQRDERLRELEAGRLRELEFDAIVFRAGPNRNHLRIRDEDLPGFAAGYVGAPFLRDHDLDRVEARAGIVVRSALEGRAIRQTIRLTTARDIRAFLEGQIDRFSISWFYDEVICSVCGQEWGMCAHRPGRRYERAGRRRVRCELEFVGPVAREVSAVNAPAVDGTGVIAELTLEETGNGEEGTGPVLAGNALVPSSPFPLPSPTKKGHTTMIDTETPESVPWIDALRSEVVGGMLARSGLSGGGMAAVRTALADDDAPTPERVQRLIEAQRTAERGMVERGLAGPRSPVRGLHPAALATRSAEAELQDALAWLAGDTRIPTPAPHLRSLRDLYLAVTGDVNFWGVFDPERAQLQSANSGTLAGMAVNALNKVVQLHYDNLITYRWYEQVVAVLPHDGSTQEMTLLHMDGIATLPTVAEGAAYTEAATGDSKETAQFTKYGSYVGITLEMMRRSDIGRIQAIPRLLVQAAIRRRSQAVAAIFTGNPVLADDGVALFHASHGNSDTTAFSAAAWEAARTRLFEQTVPGTGKPLALWPSFCLVPIELYDDALTLFGYGSGDVGKPNAAGTAQEPNVYAHSRPGDPRPIPIVVPEWTDATDWAYIVDPRLHPVIAMAYANAPAGGIHPLPELFEVRSESAGLLFSHDVLPVKVRDWWACGAATHVGVGRNVVAG